MRFDHAVLRRPSYWLALSITLVALSLLAACGSDEPTEPAAPTAATKTQAASSSAGDSDAGHTEHSAQDADTRAEHAEHGNRDGDAPSVPADAVKINLPISARATTLTREDLRVSQGDMVHLTVTADEPGEIHLHGYDLTAEVSPDHTGELTFEATTAGAFRHQFHVFGDEPPQSPQ